MILSCRHEDIFSNTPRLMLVGILVYVIVSFSMYGSIINGGILQTGNGEMPVGSYGFATTVLLWCHRH